MSTGNLLLIWAPISLSETWPIISLPNQVLTERSREQETDKVFGGTLVCASVLGELLNICAFTFCVAMVSF